MAIHLEEDFRCTRETLWHHIEEPELQKLWMKGLVANRATSPGPTRVGSTFEMDIKEGKKTTTYRGVMTEWEHLRRMAITMEGGCFGTAKLRVTYDLEPGAGTTHLSYSCGLEQPTRMMRAMLFFFGWLMKMQTKRFFRTLRTLVEKP